MLMKIIYLLILVNILLIFLIFLIYHFRWVIGEIRDICEHESGYIKLIQLSFVVLIFSCFFILLIYNLFERSQTSKLDIFLTVIVGLMGTIIGTFFSEKTMEGIKRDRDKKREKIIEKKLKIEQYKQAIEDILKELN